MAILDKNEITESLMNYYKTNFGELETDEWYEQPAVNVFVFKLIFVLFFILSTSKFYTITTQ